MYSWLNRGYACFGLSICGPDDHLSTLTDDALPPGEGLLVIESTNFSQNQPDKGRKPNKTVRPKVGKCRYLLSLAVVYQNFVTGLKTDLNFIATEFFHHNAEPEGLVIQDVFWSECFRRAIGATF